MGRKLRIIVLSLGALVLGWLSAHADYRPLWVIMEQFDYVIDCQNLGYRNFSTSDTSQVSTFEVVVREVYQKPDTEGAFAVAEGDTILVLARGNWLKDDREEYLLFVLAEHRHGYPGLPHPLFEGKTFPCDRFQPMFCRNQPDCPGARNMGSDFCACARETILKHRELVAARDAGQEVEFLREALHDVNTITVLSAMGRLRQLRVTESMTWMSSFRDHPELQIRYDLVESIPYLASEEAGQIGIWMLDDPEQKIRILAAYGLGRMRYEPAVPRLVEILEDSSRDRMVRASCLSALNKMNSPLLLPTLERVVAVEPDTALARGFRIQIDKLKSQGSTD